MTFTHSHRRAPGKERFAAVCRATHKGEDIDISEFAVKDRNTLVNICYTNSKVREVNLERDAWFRSQHPEHKP
eukprot:405295-Pleurochrysis_carterae.AAC.1